MRRAERAPIGVWGIAEIPLSNDTTVELEFCYVRRTQCLFVGRKVFCALDQIMATQKPLPDPDKRTGHMILALSHDLKTGRIVRVESPATILLATFRTSDQEPRIKETKKAQTICSPFDPYSRDQGHRYVLIKLFQLDPNCVLIPKQDRGFLLQEATSIYIRPMSGKSEPKEYEDSGKEVSIGSTVAIEVADRPDNT